MRPGSTKLFQQIVNIFPPLTSKLTKGQCGRIAVIGASHGFSAAPYYSAISALKIGGDLGHIFCNKASANAIKSYSPEIVVHPTFISEQEISLTDKGNKDIPEQWMKKIIGWKKAVNCWVVGPGLGRDPYTKEFFPYLVKNIPSTDAVIFSADAIYHLCQHPELYQELSRFRKSVISTNKSQWKQLKKFINLDISWEKWQSFQAKCDIVQVTQHLSNPDFTIVLKGKTDYIFGKRSFVCNAQGGLKRVGRLGDIFSGLSSICTHWNQDLGPVLASFIVKKATSRAYKKHGRSLTALLVIEQLSQTVKLMEEENLKLKSLL